MSLEKGPSGRLESLRNRYHAIVDEMSGTLLRTGHTVFIKETGDFSCALVTPQGEVFCAPTRLGMIRIVGMNMATAIAAAGPPREGDIWIANDPWTTGGMSTHLPDVFLWQPVFIDGELLCYVWNFVHVSDIGGRVPGSISPSSVEIFEEGLILPPTRLYKQHELNEEVLGIVLANTRIPKQTWGDLKAAVAALNIGRRRLIEMVQRYGMETLKTGQERLLGWAEERAALLIDRIPDGEYRFTDYMEGAASQGPFGISVTLRVSGSSLHLDFTGTSPQVACAYNIPTGGRGPHYYLTTAIVTLLRTWDRNIPYNGGLVRPVTVQLPEGSVVNPRPGVAIGVRAATMHRIYDVVMGCLAQALPGVIPAAGAGQGPVVVVSVPATDGGERKVSVVQPLRGGSGGRPRRDGIDGIDITVGSGRNIPTEILEQEMPLLIHKYGLRPNSAGAGEFRGGLGLELEFEVLCEEAKVACRGLERYRFRPWGLAGGRPGGLGRTIRNRGSDREFDEGRFDLVSLKRGDRLYFATPGGGGYGDRSRRAESAVRRDLLEERFDDGAGLPARIGGSSAHPRPGLFEGEAPAGVENDAVRAGGPRVGEASVSFDFGPERMSFDASGGTHG